MQNLPARVFISFLSLCLLTSGCSFNPFTQNNHLTGSATGAATGVVAGGGLAWLLGGDRMVVALAGVGGGALGYYVTTLPAAAGGIKAVNGNVFVQGDYITINLPSDQLFDSNTAELLPRGRAALASTAAVLAHFPDDSIMISGNTSGFGAQRFEQQLSERRAREVAAYLWAHGINSFAKNGVSRRKLTYVGYGAKHPVANDIRAASIRQNSHIQITAYPSRAGQKARPAEKLFGNAGSPTETASLPAKVPDTAFNADNLPEVPPGKNSDFGEEPADPSAKFITARNSATGQYK